MRKKIVWTTVFVFVAAGLYAIGRQNSAGGQPKPAAGQVATAPISAPVRMYAHHDTDHFDDNDHCISFDKPGNEKSLIVEVDLTNDPGNDPQLDLLLAYSHPSGTRRIEALSSACKRQPSSTTCKAEFKETVKLRGKLHQEWHLGDQPDGIYSTTGMLSTVAAIKTSAGVQGVFPYIFRNPLDCNVPFSQPKLK